MRFIVNLALVWRRCSLRPIKLLSVCFCKQRTAYEMLISLVGSEMCMRVRVAIVDFQNHSCHGGVIESPTRM